MTRGSRVAVSEGARSSATSTDGVVRHLHARLRLAHQVGDQAPFDVAQVGRPLGHQTAHGGEHLHELLDGRVDGREQVVAPLQVLADRGAQPLVTREAGAGGEHLRGGVGGLVGAPREPVGHGPRGLVVRREPGLLVVRRAVEAGDRLGRHVTAHHEGRRPGDAGDDRGAVEHGGGRRGAHGATLPRMGLTSQHIRA